MTKQAPLNNGRGDERFFLIGEGTLRWGGETLAIEVLNRSRSGLYVLSPGAPPIGAIVRITFTAGDRAIAARCEWTRHDDWLQGLPYLLGLRMRFSEASSLARDRWERFNRDLMGGLVYGKPSVEAHGNDRAFRRMLVPLRARLTEPDGSGAAGSRPAVLLNLSEYGAGALTQTPWRKGSVCELSVTLPDQPSPVALPAEIAWCGAAPRDLPVGLGLRIVEFEGEGKRLWETTVQEDMIVLF